MEKNRQWEPWSHAKKRLLLLTWSERLKIYCRVIVTQYRRRVEQSAIKFDNLPLLAKDRTWANCAVALGVSEALRSGLCPDGPRVHLSGLAYMPCCICPEVRLPLDQRVLCSDCFKKKCGLLVCLTQAIFSYFVLYLEPLLVSWASVSTCPFLSINSGDPCLPISSTQVGLLPVHKSHKSARVDVI